MKQFMLFSLMFIGGMRVLAQEAKFTAIVNPTTVTLNSKFKIEFKLENAKGSNFKAPAFEDFTIVNGPSTSSSVTIINGAVTQTISYVYYLKPKEIGEFVVKAAQIEVNEENLFSTEVAVKVVESKEEVPEEAEEVPEEAEETPNDPFRGFFQQQIPNTPPPKETPRKKRKKYQI